jgi:uncharacterized repeat protein (TIGR01451 family)
MPQHRQNQLNVDVVNYTITVQNNTGAPVVVQSINDTIDASFLLIGCTVTLNAGDITGSGCAQLGSTITWTPTTPVTMNDGDVLIIIITGQFTNPPGTPGTQICNSNYNVVLSDSSSHTGNPDACVTLQP